VGKGYRKFPQGSHVIFFAGCDVLHRAEAQKTSVCRGTRFYLLFLMRQYFIIGDSGYALDAWYERVALPSLDAARSADPLLDIYQTYLASFFDQALFAAVVAGTIWWSISCRQEGAATVNISSSD
jgi:hypothetical protein